MSNPFNTTTDYQLEIHAARHFIEAHKRKLAEQRQILKGLLAARKSLLAERKSELKSERRIAKIVREDHKRLLAEKRALASR